MKRSIGCQAALDSLLFCQVDGGGAEPNSCTGYLCGYGLASDSYQVLDYLDFCPLVTECLTYTIVDTCFK